MWWVVIIIILSAYIVWPPTFYTRELLKTFKAKGYTIEHSPHGYEIPLNIHHITGGGILRRCNLPNCDNIAHYKINKPPFIYLRCDKHLRSMIYTSVGEEESAKVFLRRVLIIGIISFFLIQRVEKMSGIFTLLAGNYEEVDGNIILALYNEAVEEGGEVILTEKQIETGTTRDLYNGTAWDRQVEITLTPDQYDQIRESIVLSNWPEDEKRNLTVRGEERKAISRWVFIPAENWRNLCNKARSTQRKPKEKMAWFANQELVDENGYILHPRGFLVFHAADSVTLEENRVGGNGPWQGGSIVLRSPDGKFVIGGEHILKK